MAYIGQVLENEINLQKYDFVATAGQTNFPCTYDEEVDVYLNGVKLVNVTDYTATNGTEIVLVSAAALNDVVDINAYMDVTSDLSVTKTSNTGSANLPTGTTAQRDGTPSAGYLRFNTTSTATEVYDGSSWASIDTDTGILNVVEDTTPQLGGNLDMQAHSIEGVDATEIAILDGATVTTAELNVVDMSASGSTSGQLLTSNGTGSVSTWQDAPQGVSNSKLFYFGSFN